MEFFEMNIEIKNRHRLEPIFESQESDAEVL